MSVQQQQDATFDGFSRLLERSSLTLPRSHPRDKQLRPIHCIANGSGMNTPVAVRLATGTIMHLVICLFPVFILGFGLGWQTLFA